MSYNIRRNNLGYGTPQQNNPLGQRRPPVTSSFVSGGQLSGSQQKPIVKGGPSYQPSRIPTTTPQRGPSHQNVQNFNAQAHQPQALQNQAPSIQQQKAGIQEPQPSPVQPQQILPVQQNAPSVIPPKAATPVAPTPVVALTPVPALASKVEIQSPSSMEVSNPPPALGTTDDGMEGDNKKRLFWKKGNKISKAEKLRKRNMRLSKILQPKSAIMILNELVKGCSYNVEELPVKTDAAHFRSIVNFDGQEFAGTGRTKSLARNAAAERALKYLVKSKTMTSTRKDGDKVDESGDWKMEVDGEDNQILPWSHIASFAMYKLFSTWGEDRLFQKELTDPADVILKVNTGPKEPKPAKKMPDNPELMNPLMLMHQMMPTAVWEEVESKGTPPNVVFTFSLSVEGNQFFGSGSSKKAAKKFAAFQACHKVLQVQYPPDIWTPV